MPIRTCVSCRNKQNQDTLNRLQCINKKLQLFTGFGRSFYICNNCIDETKRLEKALFRHCKNKDNYIVQLKEIFANGR